MNIVRFLVPLVVTIILNILSAVILSIWLTSPSLLWWYFGILLLTASVIVIVTLIVIWRREQRRCGLTGIASSMTKGVGSAASILKKTNDDFIFMGVAAKKWVTQEPEFDTAIKKVTRDGASTEPKFRLLLLNPNSKHATYLSRLQGRRDDAVSRAIDDSLRALKHYKDKGLNFEVKLYDFQPVFRISFIDDLMAHVGSYRINQTGERDSPQMIFRRGGDTTFYRPFREYVEKVWRNAGKVDWTKY